MLQECNMISLFGTMLLQLIHHNAPPSSRLLLLQCHHSCQLCIFSYINLAAFSAKSSLGTCFCPSASCSIMANINTTFVDGFSMLQPGEWRARWRHHLWRGSGPCQRSEAQWSCRKASQVGSCPGWCEHCWPASPRHVRRRCEDWAICRCRFECGCRPNTGLLGQYDLPALLPSEVLWVATSILFGEGTKCPYSLQIIMIPSTIPPDQERKYYNVIKHVYLRKNKVWSKDCVTFCQGSPLCINWGSQPRNGLTALNHMFDRMGGMQIRIWSISAKNETTSQQS